MSTNIYSTTSPSSPMLQIGLPNKLHISTTFERVEKCDDDLIIATTVPISKFQVYYFGIKPEKLIIISGGHKHSIEGNIYFKSLEYLEGLYRYRLLIGVKNEKFTWDRP